MVLRTAGLAPEAASIVRVYADEAPAAPAAYSAAIITGSPANVTDHEPWSERTAGWIRDAMDAELPMLGICYGHQLMAHALGGRVDYHHAGREVGTWIVRQTAAGRDDAFLRDVPEAFAAQLIHEQTVVEPPPGALVLARNAHDPHQMLRMGARAIGVQFHPEFSAPVMRAYFSVMDETLRKERGDVDALAAAVADTPSASGLVRRFLQMYASQP